jgi:hypothetical protein
MRLMTTAVDLEMEVARLNEQNESLRQVNAQLVEALAKLQSSCDMLVAQIQAKRKHDETADSEGLGLSRN